MTENMENFLDNLLKKPDLAKAIITFAYPEGFSEFLSAKIEQCEKLNNSLNYLYFLKYLEKIINDKKEISHTSESFAGHALCKNADFLKSVLPELSVFSKKLGNEKILSLQQWLQLLAFMKEFHPDSVIEFGSSSRFSKFLDKAAEIIGSNSRKYNENAKSILIYFYSQKEKDFLKLNEILKKCCRKKHAVIFHGYCDNRFLGAEHLEYKAHKFMIDTVLSDSELLYPVMNFASRNELTFFSGDYSLHMAEKEIKSIGNSFFDTSANWNWLTLNQKKTEKYYFIND